MAPGDEQTDTDTARERRNEQLKELLAACALHDRRAFAQLYQMSSAKLYGVILRILGRDEWAQDCLQEAYIKVWHNAGNYRPYIAAPMTWMITIARNQALDLLRKRRREVQQDNPGSLLGIKSHVETLSHEVSADLVFRASIVLLVIQLVVAAVAVLGHVFSPVLN